MLRLPPFPWLRPASVDEALRMRADAGPQGQFVAGGTDLWPKWSSGAPRPERVLSLHRLAELRAMHFDVMLIYHSAPKFPHRAHQAWTQKEYIEEVWWSKLRERMAEAGYDPTRALELSLGAHEARLTAVRPGRDIARLKTILREREIAALAGQQQGAVK